MSTADRIPQQEEGAARLLPFGQLPTALPPEAAALIARLEQVQRDHERLSRRLADLLAQQPSRSRESAQTLELPLAMSPTPRNALVLRIDEDARSWVLLPRLVGFLLSRVDREHLGQVLEHYERLGWVGTAAIDQALAVAEGELQDIHDDHIEQQEALLTASAGGDLPPFDRTEWRLTAQDHLTSLWFVKSLSGVRVDAQGWRELQRDIETML